MTSEKRPSFSFSPSALTKIEELRRIYEDHNKVNTDAIMIGWGSNSETGQGGLVLSFFSVIETIEVSDTLQIINGLKVQLFTTPKYYSKFDGQTIDYQPDKGFFSRLIDHAPHAKGPPQPRFTCSSDFQFFGGILGFSA